MSVRETADFWSRRKAAVRAEAAKEQARAVRQAERRAAARIREAQAGKSDAEILESLGLPDPETLTVGDDFTAFLSKAVPEHLRRVALRRLWGSNPVLANLDGLVDYDEDFTLGSVASGTLKTVYQVGRGAVARMEEGAVETPARVSDPVSDIVAAATGEPDEGGADMVLDAQHQTQPEGGPDLAPDLASDPAEGRPNEVPAARRPRHMQFTFTTDEPAT